MRAEKIIDVNGKSITVKELRTSDVIELIEGPEGNRVLGGIMVGMPSDIKKLMAKGVDVNAEEFEALVDGINGFTALEAAFREVNSSFFASLPQRTNSLLRNAKAIKSQTDHSSK